MRRNVFSALAARRPPKYIYVGLGHLADREVSREFPFRPSSRARPIRSRYLDGSGRRSGGAWTSRPAPRPLSVSIHVCARSRTGSVVTSCASRHASSPHTSPFPSTPSLRAPLRLSRSVRPYKLLMPVPDGVFSRHRLLGAMDRDGAATFPNVEYANRAEEWGTAVERVPEQAGSPYPSSSRRSS